MESRVQLGDLQGMKANKAHPVDAPIASLFQLLHHRRRATDAQR